MLLARFLLAGSVALMVAWALLVGALFQDPSLLAGESAGGGADSAKLAAAIEEIELLRDEVASLRDASLGSGEAAPAAATAPAIPAAGAPEEAPSDGSATPPSGDAEPAFEGYPGYESPHLHRVAEGETLSSIAQLYGTTVHELAAANELGDPSAINVGSMLVIP